MKNYLQTNTVSKMILALAIILVILLIFQAGVAVGYRRGAFSSNWSSAYGRGLDDPRSIFAPFVHDSDDINPHGAVGDIVSVRLPGMMIKGPNSAEQVVTISPTTTVRFIHSVASTSDLTPGSQVIVIGEPQGNGSIDATFIRIMPASPVNNQ